MPTRPSSRLPASLIAHIADTMPRGVRGGAVLLPLLLPLVVLVLVVLAPAAVEAQVQYDLANQVGHAEIDHNLGAALAMRRQHQQRMAGEGMMPQQPRSFRQHSIRPDKAHEQGKDAQPSPWSIKLEKGRQLR